MAPLQRSTFGQIGTREVERFELSNDRLTVGVLTYGATIQSLLVADRDGVPADVTLGFDDLAGYIGPHPYFGAVIGRFANRIAGGRFELEGEQHWLPVNRGPNCLHGGTEGFDRRMWTARPIEAPGAAAVELSLTSPDGDMGFPGTLEATVRYTLQGNDLTIAYAAVTDRTTVVNLTNHAYFNLAGAGAGTIENHLLTLAASRYTPVDDDLIPTGELAAVEGTPMDFREAKPIGTHLRADDPQLVRAQGYDHNWVLDDAALDNADGGGRRMAARAHDPGSGRVLEVLTDQPGLQFYSGNFLDGSLVGKGGRAYRQGDGFCLETQHFPDSPNHEHFPTTVLHPGESYTTSTTFRFGLIAQER
jgi:aldose 1-epimerase